MALKLPKPGVVLAAIIALVVAVVTGWRWGPIVGIFAASTFITAAAVGAHLRSQLQLRRARAPEKRKVLPSGRL